MAKRENKFQAELIKELKDILPGCEILKNDSGYKQGIPDLSVYHGSKWAMLECKKSEHERHQPNQDDYVDIFNRMSYASFIYPENKKKVIEDLREHFR